MKTPQQLQTELLQTIAAEWTATDAAIYATNDRIAAAAQLCNDSTTADDIIATQEPITYPTTIRLNGAPETLRTDTDARKILEQILYTFAAWSKTNTELRAKSERAQRSLSQAQRNNQ